MHQPFTLLKYEMISLSVQLLNIFVENADFPGHVQKWKHHQKHTKAQLKWETILPQALFKS